ncbi:hypothetical protein K435DRAFT_810066 [Dendrothele bispora CBS 962.96]|uniref:Uncharacterized protein n=1 Tax=Dendrothele bispora (strain CBS 962.96) TaxID=1314807 RepID=A0A4S8KW87_DENBC|nr:hypothetical protein K435DRAFT_810066 [Dendrothele bispora CBS 962.96]
MIQATFLEYRVTQKEGNISDKPLPSQVCLEFGLEDVRSHNQKNLNYRWKQKQIVEVVEAEARDVKSYQRTYARAYHEKQKRELERYTVVVRHGRCEYYRTLTFGVRTSTLGGRTFTFGGRTSTFGTGTFTFGYKIIIFSPYPLFLPLFPTYHHYPYCEMPSNSEDNIAHFVGELPVSILRKFCYYTFQSIPGYVDKHPELLSTYDWINLDDLHGFLKDIGYRTGFTLFAPVR